VESGGQELRLACDLLKEEKHRLMGLVARDSKPLLEHAQVPSRPEIIDMIRPSGLEPHLAEIDLGFYRPIGPVDEGGHHPPTIFGLYGKSEDRRQLVLEEITRFSSPSIGREDPLQVFAPPSTERW